MVAVAGDCKYEMSSARWHVLFAQYTPFFTAGCAELWNQNILLSPLNILLYFSLSPSLNLPAYRIKYIKVILYSKT